MQIPLPSFVTALSRRFLRAGQPLYAVGGIVRNTLLRLPLSDLDLCGPMPAEDVAALLAKDPDFSARVRPTGFGSVEITETASGTVAEYTTFRTDSYREGHRPHSVVFTSELPLDAARRDFTVNALYADAEDGTVLDPTGGLFDLSSRLLRAVRDADLVMREDGQRILRMVRFAAQLGFSVDRELFAAAFTFRGNLRDLTGERLWEEWEKILVSDVRYPSVPDGDRRLEKALRQLMELEADRILTPHLPWQTARLPGSPADTALRLSLLLASPAASEPDLTEDLRALRIPRREQARVLRFSRFLRSPSSFSLTQAGREDASLLARADSDASALYARLTETDAPFSLREMKFTGEDVRRITSLSGKAVGEILQRAFLYCLAHPEENTNERLACLCRNGFFSERNPKNQTE